MTTISYADGKFLPTEQISIQIQDDLLGVLRGYRIFTACRTINKKIFMLNEHIARLFSSAEKLSMKLSINKIQLADLIKQTVDKNLQDLFLDIIITGGACNPTGLKQAEYAKIYIMSFPFIPLPKDYYENGVALASFPFQRQFATIKLTNYIGAIMAHNSVVKKFNAYEALFIAKHLGLKPLLLGCCFAMSRTSTKTGF